jgi:uncharacterized protein YcsI (UPF0317 family)
MESVASPYPNGLMVRLASRKLALKIQTSGVAPTYLQANLIILPSKYASSFRQLCHRNPVPCPLLAESNLSNPRALRSWLQNISGEMIAKDIDLRTDAPRYMVYRDGVLSKSHCEDVQEEWTDDHVGFLIGCSYSFETALTAAGLPPLHTVLGRNVPMYRTNIPLCPAGVFTGGAYVVSMRPYKKSDVETVRDITRPYMATHGEAIAWGWEAVEQLGIKDIYSPEWGDAPLSLMEDELVPVFWGCGVTPQEAVMRAKLEGVVMGHAPGHMIVLDLKEGDIIVGQ